MTRKATLALSALVTIGAAHSFASLVYDVTFEDPPHANGAAPVYGSGTDRPSQGQNFVVSNLTLFGSQTALVAPDGLYAYMGFDNTTSFTTTGVHTVAWDWELVLSDPNEVLQTSVVLGNPSSYIALSYNRDGSISAYDGYGTTNAGFYSPDTVYHYTVTLDLNASQYSLWIDGQQQITNQDFAVSSFNSVNFYRPFGSPSYAVDNVQWDIIPEPATWMLIVIGVAGLALHRQTGRTRDLSESER